MKDRTAKRVNGFFLSLVLLHLIASILVSMLSLSAVEIGTFGTLQAKGVIRDVCRVMDLPYSRGDQLASVFYFSAFIQGRSVRVDTF